MSGTIGHFMYAILGAKAAADRRLPVAAIAGRHFASYLAGSYLGCDIQTMPEAICVDTGIEVGYGTVPVEKSPITGGGVRAFKLRYRDEQYTPRQIHDLFYGRAHVVFGWTRPERDLAVPWDHLADYCGLVVDDAIELFGPGERPLAYVLGWMAHVVGDSLIKSVQPGVDLELLDGKYTARNRPVQDLFTYHEVGAKELRLNWAALIADAAETPVEVVQPHYMRIGNPGGELGATFRDGWRPDQAGLLNAVLVENRRYFPIWAQRELQRLALRKSSAGWECDPELSRQAGGLSYAEMVAAAEKANFRRALWQIGEAVADLFTQVVARSNRLRAMPATDAPDWAELTSRWKTR